MTQNKPGYSIFDGTIADMTWMEVEQAAINDSIMLVPIGTIEQHGPHLPLGTDTYGSDAVIETVGFHVLVDTMGSRSILTK